MPRNNVSSADKKAIEEWLKNNKVTICPPTARSDPDEIKKKYGWGSKKK